MKKYLFIIFATILSIGDLLAQNAASIAYRIPLSTYVHDNGTLASGAQSTIERKMCSMTTINGYGSTAGDFVLVADGSLVDLSTTPTVPVRYVAAVEVLAMVVNTLEEVVVGSKTFSLKGVGASKEQAAINAINLLNPRGDMCVKFMTESREKIETYYMHQLPNIKAKALSASERGDYKFALAVLGAVPESLPEYPEIAKMMTDFYLKMIDRDAAAMLQEAKAAYARRDYYLSLDILGKINPLSNKYTEADELIGKITEFYEKEYQTAEKERVEDRERMIQERKEDRAEAIEIRKNLSRLEELRIGAAKEVAVANAGIVSLERQNKTDFFKVLLASIAKK